MPRYFIEVTYKGTNFSGFQVQHNAITIQSEVERAFRIKFTVAIRLTGSSRTDAGVHALQNYFHFDAEKSLFSAENNEAETSRCQEVLYSLNAILPPDIVIQRIFRVGETSHSRFDALSREYKYCIYSRKNPFHCDTAFFYPYPIDVEGLQRAAALILETRDFSSFSKRNTQVLDFLCKVYRSQWKVEDDLLIYNVVANRFLRGMVKGLVGTMLRVGTGKISLQMFENIIKSNNCNRADFSVPSCGLFLVAVTYQNPASTGSVIAGS